MFSVPSVVGFKSKTTEITEDTEQNPQNRFVSLFVSFRNKWNSLSIVLVELIENNRPICVTVHKWDDL